MTGPYLTVIIGKDALPPKEDPGDELRAETDRETRKVAFFAISGKGDHSEHSYAPVSGTLGSSESCEQHDSAPSQQ
jgi:hypothetical protein